MSFAIFTDTASNLPAKTLRQNDLTAVPLDYIIGGTAYQCLDVRAFDAEKFYADIKNGMKVTTSQVPPQRFVEAFTPALEAGQDVLYLGVSSGISGTYQSAVIAASQLREAYPHRHICTVDTLAASLGEGLFVLEAASYRDRGLDVREAAARLDQHVPSMCQLVLLDDLMYLHRGGRLSGTSAVIGTVLGIRPILKGDQEGHLVVSGKCRGRAAGLNELVRRYQTLVHRPEEQVVGITYTTDHTEAQALADRIRAVAAPKDVQLVRFEPVTGSYMGPGVTALFFRGKEDVRLK